ncbi:transposase family protein [uncultured Capnocytophaga sp.]|uniref:transposase family protein n=1 Tax=uncultured Capnocytophaga sp. TaxID=159273 RepID=UPI00261DA6BC|nr:transposase family protein [uncultured Capnocytophaga sp.]
MSAEIWNAIAVVKDPRVQGRIDYPLGLILLVSLYATISGCDDWEQIEDYANIHSEDLRNLYTKLSGKELKVSRMPTHDTFNPPLARFLQLVPIIERAFSSLSYPDPSIR